MNNKNREMTDDEVSIFVTLRSTSRKNIENMYEDLIQQSWVLKAIGKHCEAFELECEKSVQIMILTIGDGVVGHCVKYLNIVHEWAHRSGQKQVTIEDFATKIFPFGFPNFTV